MHYRIEDKGLEICVYDRVEDTIFLRVTRNSDLIGNIKFKFYIKGELILETSKKNKIFGYKLSIPYQNLEAKISISEGPLGYQLNVNDNICKIYWNHVGQNEDLFYWNDKVIGSSDTRDTKWLSDLIYFCHFNENKLRNLYALILFIMQTEYISG